MKRFVDGVTGEFFFQKRVPKGAPDWLQTATFTFPSGRTATELVANDAAHLAWAVNLGVIDFNPHPVRRADLDCPDELRVDLDPHARGPLEHGPQGRDVRQGGPRGPRPASASRRPRARAASTSTSGSSRAGTTSRSAAPRWPWPARSSAASPKRATSKWWKEERHGVFVDYNQNARDRTIASGYSVRPVPDAKVCCPITWDEVPDVEPGDLRLDTVPARLKKQGDPAADIDEHAGSLDKLLDLARRDEEEGLGDAPWPPHFRKQRGEPKRVQPSKDRTRSRPRAPRGDTCRNSDTLPSGSRAA